MARRNRNSRKKQQTPGWVWMLCGLAIGLVVAAGVYFRAPPPARPAAAANAATTAAPATPASASTRTPAATERRETRPSSARPAPAEAAASTEPRFDFYEILPQF